MGTCAALRGSNDFAPFPDMLAFTHLPPLGLYVHVPWCVRKCPYCDFNSHPLRGVLPEEDFIAALIADLEAELPSVWGRSVDTLFFGGGTPSLLSPDAVGALLSAIRARIPLRPDAEITLEANPGTVEQGRFAAYRGAGVNRLSIGVQSFENDALRRLGRIHDRRQAHAAVEAARRAGFERINLDLMFGLPGQTLAQAAADVRQALCFDPGHISYYQLTIEPNTAFHHHPPVLPGDDEAAAMQEEGQTLLAEAGYVQYEVSAYAREGRSCRHNLNYWQFGDYLGIGPGAHGKISGAEGIRRRWKVRHPSEYVERAVRADCVAGEEILAPRRVAFEFMMNALRLREGFAPELFDERAGLPLIAVEHALSEARRRGLLERTSNRIRPTALGYRFLNDLLELFLPDAP